MSNCLLFLNLKTSMKQVFYAHKSTFSTKCVWGKAREFAWVPTGWTPKLWVSPTHPARLQLPGSDNCTHSRWRGLDWRKVRITEGWGLHCRTRMSAVEARRRAGDPAGVIFERCRQAFCLWESDHAYRGSVAASCSPSELLARYSGVTVWTIHIQDPTSTKRLNRSFQLYWI